MRRTAISMVLLLFITVIALSIPTSYSMIQSTIINEGNVVFDSDSKSKYGITITGDHESSEISDKTKDPIIKDKTFPTGSTILNITEPRSSAFEGNSPNGYSETTLSSDGSHPFWIYMNALSNKNNTFSCTIVITNNNDETKAYDPLILTGNKKNNPPGESFLVMDEGVPAWSSTCNSNNAFKDIKMIKITIEATSQGKSPMYLYMVVDNNTSTTDSQIESISIMSYGYDNRITSKGS